jgi:predicted nucleic-acid-binding protein
MATALEWVLETILDELDTIIDERDMARGIVRTQAARQAGRKVMEQKVRAMLRNEEAAVELRSAGADNVRAAVRRMYELKLFN